VSGPVTEPVEEEEAGGELDSEVYLLEVNAEFDECISHVVKHFNRIKNVIEEVQ